MTWFFLVVVVVGLVGVETQKGMNNNLDMYSQCKQNRFKLMARFTYADLFFCDSCLSSGENLFVVRGSVQECLPCNKFPQDGNGKFFALHFVSEKTFCSCSFLRAPFRMEDMGCGAQMGLPTALVEAAEKDECLNSTEFIHNWMFTQSMNRDESISTTTPTNDDDDMISTTIKEEIFHVTTKASPPLEDQQVSAAANETDGRMDEFHMVCGDGENNDEISKFLLVMLGFGAGTLLGILISGLVWISRRIHRRISNGW